MRVLRAAVVAFSLQVGCSTPTEIVLAIDSDLAVGTEIDRVRIEAKGMAMEPSKAVVDLNSAGAPTFPLTLGLRGSGNAGVEVTIAGELQGLDVVTQRARGAFVAGNRRILRMTLMRRCMRTSCTGAQTCAELGCRAVDRAPDELPSWEGGTPERWAAIPGSDRSVWRGYWHSCAADGPALYCWGQNTEGQLGSGSQTNAITRQGVPGIVGVVSAEGAFGHTCACSRRGQVFCAGLGEQGQLCSGTERALTLRQVPGIEDCSAVSVGFFHTCLLRTSGTVACWGDNKYGQLGDGTTQTRTMPVAVPEATGIVQIAAGGSSTCALEASGAVLCWGANQCGQIGDGTGGICADSYDPMINAAPTRPTRVISVSDAVEIVAGRWFVCARRAAGTVVCWGANSQGQLGRGSRDRDPHPTPTPVIGIDNAVQIAAGLGHTCVLRRSGKISCWGSGIHGQLGDGGYVDSLSL